MKQTIFTTLSLLFVIIALANARPATAGSPSHTPANPSVVPPPVQTQIVLMTQIASATPAATAASVTPAPYPAPSMPVPTVDVYPGPSGGPSLVSFGALTARSIPQVLLLGTLFILIVAWLLWIAWHRTHP